MSKLNYIIIFLFFIYACNNKTTTTSLLKEVQTINIKINNKTLNNSDAVFYIKTNQGKRLLSYLNRNEREIQFYDLTKCSLDFAIKIANEGENAVPEFSGFFVLNLDTIILSAYNYKLYFINKEGKVFKKINYTYNDSSQLTSFCSFQSEPYTPLVKIKNDLFLEQYPKGTWSVLPKLNLMRTKICLLYNLQTNQKQLLAATIPVSYVNSGQINFFYSRCFDGKYFYYNFPADHKLYRTGINHKELKPVEVKSKYIKQFLPVPSNPYKNSNTLNNYTAQNPQYVSLIYDKYRKVFYRFVFPGYKLKSDENARNLISYRSRFSIMVLDKDLNILSETLMPKDTYDMRNYFVAERGLYVSKSHIRNSDYSDDILSYGLLKLMKK